MVGIVINWKAHDLSKLQSFISTTTTVPCGQFFPFFFSFFFFYKFIYFWLYWVFIAVRGLSLLAASSGYSLLWCAGFSLRWLLLQSTGSRRAGFSSSGSRALERRLCSCGAWA